MGKDNGVIDIDARAASFQPVKVKFRGAEHALGGSGMSLVAATAVYKAHPREEDESEIAYGLRLVDPMLRALSPSIAEQLEVDGLTTAEELAFMPVLTEVVKRIGALRFRA